MSNTPNNNNNSKSFFSMICPNCGRPSTDKDLAQLNGLNAFDKGDENPIICPLCDQGSMAVGWVESEL